MIGRLVALIVALAAPLAAQAPAARERVLHLDAARLMIPEAGPNGGWELASIKQVRPLADGGLIVATETEMHRFSATGTHVSLLGHAGERAGDFQGINGAVVCPSGDIIASDWIQQRLTLLTGPRAVAHVARYPAGAFSNGVTVLSCDSDGVTLWDGVGAGPTGGAEPARLRADTQVIYRTASDLTAERVLLRVPAQNEYAGLPQPFGSTTLVAPSAAGIVTCNTADSIVRIFGRNGVLRTLALLVPARRPVTAALRATWLAQAERNSDATTWSGQLKGVYAAMPWPAWQPRWSDMIVDDDQRIWLQEYRSEITPDATPDRWHLVGADGHLDGMLAIAGPDRLLGVHHGEAIVLHVTDTGHTIEVRHISGF